jgi:5-formyltetrahydrofolate cyclo-ligase
MKAEVRRRIRAARAGRTPAADFVDRVLARVPRGSVDCCYVALPGEPPTHAIIEALLARGDEVYLPVAGSGEDMALPGPQPHPPNGSGDNPTSKWSDSHQDPKAGPGDRRHLHWVPAATSRPWAAWGVGGRTCPVLTQTLPTPDVIIVPALAVDPGGRRLGQGGGFYDRFVPQYPRARTIALLWSGEVVPDVGAEPHDITVDEWVVADG